jgi:hypothetical protein
MGADDDEDDDGQRLILLNDYLKSSPECAEVCDLLSSKLPPQNVSNYF